MWQWRKTGFLVMVVAILTLILAACEEPDDEGGAADDNALAENLIGTEWILDTIRGNDAHDETRVTLEFQENEVVGFGGCNSYGGQHTIEDGQLRVTELVSTDQACEEPAGIMEQENEFFTTLSMDANRLYQENDHLLVEDTDGDTALDFTKREPFAVNPDDLVDTTWQLIAIQNDDLIEDANIRLAFAEDDFVTYAGCQLIEGVYEAEDDAIRFPEMSLMESQCMRPEQDSLQQQQFLQHFGITVNFNLVDDRLELHSQIGEVLEFETLPGDAELGGEDMTWKLTHFVENGESQPVIEGSDVTLIIENGVLQPSGDFLGHGGCNGYSASYTFSAESLEIEAPETTLMLCEDPEGVSDQEGRYFRTLHEVTTAHIDGDELTLETDAGTRLLFVPQT